MVMFQGAIIAFVSVEQKERILELTTLSAIELSFLSRLIAASKSEPWRSADFSEQWQQICLESFSSFQSKLDCQNGRLFGLGCA